MHLLLSKDFKKMKIDSKKIKQIVCILLDIEESNISNIYTFNLGEYLITFKLKKDALLLCFKEGNIDRLV